MDPRGTSMQDSELSKNWVITGKPSSTPSYTSGNPNAGCRHRIACNKITRKLIKSGCIKRHKHL